MFNEANTVLPERSSRPKRRLTPKMSSGGPRPRSPSYSTRRAPPRRPPLSSKLSARLTASCASSASPAGSRPSPASARCKRRSAKRCSNTSCTASRSCSIGRMRISRNIIDGRGCDTRIHLSQMAANQISGRNHSPHRAVCRDHVDAEFAMLCRKLAAALARSKKEVWACAVMYALGQVNFLFGR